MAKKQKQKEASPDDITLATLCDWVTDCEDATDESRELSEKSRDYYDSRQLSDAEVRSLKKRKQAPVVINRIKPKIDALMGMEKAAKTTVKAFPRNPEDEKSSEAATEAIRFVMEDQDFGVIRAAVWEHILIEGTGGAEVVIKYRGEKPYVCLESIKWDRIIYDPHSRRKDFSDARYLGQVVWLDYDQALDRFPEGADVLETMIEGSETYDDKPRWLDTKRNRVKIVEMYYYEGKDVYYACFTRGGFLKPQKISPYKNEEGETEWPYEFQSAFVDREGGRYGAVRQLLDVQDEINKRRSKALHLMSVRQVMWERGAVEDINKAREELARPDGVVEVTPGMVFEVLKTGDMAAAQFNLLTEAKMEIDNVGANAATQGKDKTVQSGVALRERQQAGMTEVGPLFDALKHWQHRMFRKIWNRIKQFWKDEMWIRVTDDEQSLRWVGLNAPMTRGQMALEQAQQDGLPPEQLQMLAQQIQQDPRSQEVVKTQNNVAELDVDIIVAEVPDSITRQMEDFQVIGEMVKSGFPMPPQAVIEASPLSNKDRILKLMKEQPQLPPEHIEQMKKMQEEAQKLAQENQALKADQQTEMAKLQQKQQSDLAELDVKKQVQAAELQLEKERAEAEIAIQMMKAKADAQVAQMKLAVDSDQKERELQHTMACDQQEMEMKRAEQVKTDEATAMPNFTKVLTELVTGFAESQKSQQQMMEGVVKAMEAIAAEVSKPKTVILGGINRDSEGQISGATARVTH